MSEHPDDIQVLQVRGLDYSYGPVQVLFDCGLEVHRGETLALLGNQRCGQVHPAAGGHVAWACPIGGPIRLNGRTITYADARAALQARESCKCGAVPGWFSRPHGGGEPPGHHAEHQSRQGRRFFRRVERVYYVFGVLREKRTQAAADLFRWAAADAGLRHGADARARGAAHRRSVAGPSGGSGAAGSGGRSESDRADHDPSWSSR